jgi:hypothetical protein
MKDIFNKGMIECMIIVKAILQMKEKNRQEVLKVSIDQIRGKYHQKVKLKLIK